MTSSKKTPMQAALARKHRLSRTYLMPVADPAAAYERLTRAQSDLRQAVASGADGTVQQQALDDATGALAACWHRIVLHNVPPGQFEALLKQHPPSHEQKQAGAQWDPDTFQPALIAACADEAGLTADEWAVELASDRWSMAERNELFAEALAVNTVPATRPAQ